MTKPTPYWWRAIETARKRGHFTEEDIARAHGWTTCACGKQDKRIPRSKNLDWENGRPANAPLDARLYALGGSFYEYVMSNAFYKAERALVAIERRAAALIKMAKIA